MEIRQNTEDPIQIHDRQQFVDKQDVTTNEAHVPAYTIDGPDNHVIGIEPQTPVSFEFRDSSGEKLDGSSMVKLQKADIQGNPIGSAIIFNHNLNAFDYEKMRSDPQYYKYTNKPLLLRERESLYVFIDIPDGANDFSAEMSRMTIGDNVTSTGKPVYIRHVDTLEPGDREALAGR